MSPLSCLTSPVLSPMACLPSPDSCLPYPVHVSNLLSHISCLTSLPPFSSLSSPVYWHPTPVTSVVSSAAEQPLIWPAPRSRSRLRLQAKKRGSGSRQKKGSSRRLQLLTLNFSFQLCKISLLIKIKFCDPVPLRRITVTAVNAKVNYRALLL